MKLHKCVNTSILKSGNLDYTVTKSLTQSYWQLLQHKCCQNCVHLSDILMSLILQYREVAANEGNVEILSYYTAFNITYCICPVATVKILKTCCNISVKML